MVFLERLEQGALPQDILLLSQNYECPQCRWRWPCQHALMQCLTRASTHGGPEEPV